MRALREIVGGLSLAGLVALTVLGGLWLAVTENGRPLPQQTPVAAFTESFSPTFTPLTLSPTQAASPLPTKVTLAPTLTHTRTPTPITPTLLLTVSATTLPNTATAHPSPTFTQTPTVCLPPPTWVAYPVAPGDTLFQLSLRFDVSLLQLQNANCLSSTEIKFNQVIYVPFLLLATPTATISATPTATSISSPLQINGLTLVSVQRDPDRPNGAIANLFIDFSGGLAPYTIYNDNVPQASNPIPILTDCGGTLIHTLKVLSANGQSVERPYYYSPVVCP